VILVGKTLVKKIGRKILPKDSKRMNPVQIFGILVVQGLPFRLRYQSFGSPMPAYFYVFTVNYCDEKKVMITRFKNQENNYLKVI
jgi:hypothetical protein